MKCKKSQITTIIEKFCLNYHDKSTKFTLSNFDILANYHVLSGFCQEPIFRPTYRKSRNVVRTSRVCQHCSCSLSGTTVKA